MSKKKYKIIFTMDYDYIEQVGVREIFPDGSEGLYKELPRIEDNAWSFEVPDDNNSVFEINSVFGLSLPEIKKRIDFYEKHKYEYTED